MVGRTTYKNVWVHTKHFVRGESKGETNTLIMEGIYYTGCRYTTALFGSYLTANSDFHQGIYFTGLCCYLLSCYQLQKCMPDEGTKLSPMSTQTQELVESILSLADRAGFTSVDVNAARNLVKLIQNFCASAHKPIRLNISDVIYYPLTVFNEEKGDKNKTMEDLFYSFSALVFKTPLGRLATARLFKSFQNRSKSITGFDSLGGSRVKEPLDVIQIKLNPDVPDDAIQADATHEQFSKYNPYGFRNCNIHPIFTSAVGSYTLTPEHSVLNDEEHVAHKPYDVEDMSDSSDNDDALPMIQPGHSEVDQNPPWNQLPPDLIEEPAICFLCDSLMEQFSKSAPLPTVASQFDKIEPFLIPPPSASHRAFGGYGPALNQLLERNCQLGT